MLRARSAGRLFPVLLLALALPSRPASAQTPYFVFTVKSLDELLGDISHIASGGVKTQGPSPIEGMILSFTGGRGLAGVDRSKPLGVYAAAPRQEGGSPQIVVWIPVKDAGQFLALFGMAAPPGEGRPFALNLAGRPAFARLSHGHCFIAMEPGALERASVPRGRAGGKHDISFELDFSHLADKDKKSFMAQLLARMDDQRAAARGESEAYLRGHEFGRKVALESISRALEEAEELGGGFSFEKSTGNFALEYELVAKAGTKLAADCEAVGASTPGFAALAANDAALSIVCSTKVTDEIRQLASQFAAAEEAAHAEIDSSHGFSNVAAREKAHEGMASFTKSFHGLDQIDAALVLDRTPSGKIILVAAGKVGSGKEFSNFIEKLLDADPTKFGIRSLKLNAASHGGARIHALTLVEDFNDALGMETAHLAVRGDSIHLVAGGDSLSAVKASLDKTSGRPPRRPPLSVHARPSKMLEIIARKAPAPKIESARQAFAGQGDFASLEMVPVPRGVKVRVTLGSAFLRLIWNLTGQGAGGAGAGARGPRGARG